MQNDLLTGPKTILTKEGFFYGALLAAFFIFGLAFLREARYFYFGIEGIYFVGRGMKALSDPTSLFQPDFAFRFHPLFFALESILYRFFGLNALAQLVTLITLHLTTVFLLFDFVRRLGISSAASLLGSIFFLFLGSHWTLIFDISQVARLGAALFFLLSLISFHTFLTQESRRDYALSLVFFLASIGFGEDSVILPLLLFCLIFWVKGRNRSVLKYGLLTAPFLFLGFWYAFLSFKAGSAQLWKVGWGPYVAVKTAYFFKDFVHFLIIPRAELAAFLPLPAAWARGIPALLAGAYIFWVLKTTNRNSTGPLFTPLNIRFLSFSFAWTLIACLLYAARPTEGWEWHSRYFYFTGMGICMMGGFLSHRLWLRLRESNRVIKAGFGVLLLFIWNLNLQTNLFMIHKLNLAEETGENGETRPALFSLENRLIESNGPFQPFPKGTVLALEHSPFELERLKEVLSIYYGFLPDRIVLGGREEIRALPLDPDGALLHFTWDGHQFIPGDGV